MIRSEVGLAISVSICCRTHVSRRETKLMAAEGQLVHMETGCFIKELWGSNTA